MIDFSNPKEVQESKDLLLKVISDNLPYGLIVKFENFEFEVRGVHGDMVIHDAWHLWNSVYTECGIIYVKPFLRSMNTMTEEEKIVYGDLCYAIISDIPKNEQKHLDELYDWLNANHFDYRGLITMGLASEAPKGLYC